MSVARRLVFPLVLAVLWAGWAVAVQAWDAWGLYATRWPMVLTMVFGSFIAGSTPAGGGAVAYPVFTKLLSIPTADAALFGLMIQAVGMNMAGLFILCRRIRICLPVWRWSVAGAIPGVVIGLSLPVLPANLPRLTFSCILLVFAITLYRSHWRRRHAAEEQLRHWAWPDRARFLAAGLLGGLVASQTGSGADMLAFMVMTIGYGLRERIAVPTSVVIMGTVSAVGFAFRLLQPAAIGVVWEYWAVAVPVVALGAPLGAWVASWARGGLILAVVFALVAVEVATTLWLVPIDAPRAAWAIAVLAVAAAAFRRLRALRERDFRAPAAGPGEA